MPPTTKNQKSIGRQPKLRDWTDSEADHEAELFVRGMRHSSERLLRLICSLRDYLALTEERLLALDDSSNKQISLVRLLNEWHRGGLIDLAPPLVSFDLKQAGLRPLAQNNSRAWRVWALGPVGKPLSQKLWETAFTPIGGAAHMAHHALAAEVMFRFRAAAKAVKSKDYEMRGPRDASMWEDINEPKEGRREYAGQPSESDATPRRLVMSADGLLIERKPDGAAGAMWLLEYHNEERGGRAKEKIMAYDRLAQAPDVWRNAWGLETMPKVLVVWRYPAVLRDYQLQLKEMAVKRRGDYAGASWPLPQFRHLSLADALSDKVLNMQTLGTDIISKGDSHS